VNGSRPRGRPPAPPAGSPPAGRLPVSPPGFQGGQASGGRPAGARSIDQILAEARSRLARLTPEQAFAESGAGATLIDIRPAAQRAAAGEVPGSVVIERNHLEWRLDPASEARLPWVTGYGLRFIVICAEGYTSSLAAAALQDLGLARATDVAGGYQAWQEAGLPTARPAGRAVVIAPGPSPAYLTRQDFTATCG
jgi:rhodanese-related sulfurtransferase